MPPAHGLLSWPGPMPGSLSGMNFLSEGSEALIKSTQMGSTASLSKRPTPHEGEEKSTETG